MKFNLIYIYFLSCICFIKPINSIGQKIQLQSQLIQIGLNQKNLQTPYNGLHGFYKKYISSQDGSNCHFSPSCSHYAKLAIKKYNIFKGILLTTDRLIRCNGRLEEYIILENGKALDNP